LPPVVCPDGSPQTPLSDDGLEPPQPPGVSPLDEPFGLAPRDRVSESAGIITDEVCGEEVRHEG
jgi:hypothetical protein